MTDVDETAHLFGTRRGWPLIRRVREPDSYGLLLFLIVVVLLTFPLAGGSLAGTAISVGVTAAMLLFAVHTSGGPRRAMRVFAVVGPLAVAGALLSRIASSRAAGVFGALATTLLVLIALVAVSRRLLQHPAVGGTTILAAVSVYLLLGLLFASVYGAFGALGEAFVQQPDARGVTVIYFSFVTLATVGYGDLTPGGDLLRMIAILEALSGELYLVTVIAVLVGNVGAARPRRRGGSA